MRLDTGMRGDFFQVVLILFEGDVLAGCSGEAAVVGAEEDHLSLSEMRNEMEGG